MVQCLASDLMGGCKRKDTQRERNPHKRKKKTEKEREIKKEQHIQRKERDKQNYKETKQVKMERDVQLYYVSHIFLFPRWRREILNQSLVRKQNSKSSGDFNSRVQAGATAVLYPG
jgi:hypothetical protein